ncbi:MAG: TonB-dependent receptor plug domain-containing protein, partial [Candidatus Kapaibacterium sp.]
MRTILLILVLTGLSPDAARATSDRRIRSCVTTDSTDAADTTASGVPQTRLYALTSFHGSVLADTSIVWQSISKHDIQPWMYTSHADVFDLLLPLFPISLGYHGQPHAWRALGGGMRDNAFLFNGRPLNDVGSGVTNTAAHSPEDMERVQVLIGSSAVVLADQASGMGVNVQEQWQDTKGPYSRMWYADGANNYYASDGILSQNIARDLNMTVGFKRQAGDGRFDNQWLDAWNVRARLRWMPRAWTTISLSENFSNHGTVSNGGVYVKGSPDINDDVTVIVRLPDANERTFRHDVTLSVSSAVDSTLRSVMQASVYMSHAAWELFRSAVMVSVADSAVSAARSVSVRAGMTGKWERELGQGLRTTVGGDVEFNRSDATDYAVELRRYRAAAFAFSTFRADPRSLVSGGIRAQTTASASTLSAGASVRHRISEPWSIMVDASSSARLPSAVEASSGAREETMLGMAQVTWTGTSGKFDVLGFVRQSRNVGTTTVLTDTTGRYPVRSVLWTIPEQRVVGAHVRTTVSPVRDVWVDVM